MTSHRPYDGSSLSVSGLFAVSRQPDVSHIAETYDPQTVSAIGELIRLEPDQHLRADLLERPPAAREADILMTTWGAPKLDEQLLDAMPNLKAVFYAAGSIRGFMTQAAWERGIRVFSAYSANAVPVAEFTAATIVLSLKRVWGLMAGTRAGRSFECRAACGPGAYRTRVGLVSFGAIARATADRLRATDVELLVYDPFAPPETIASHGARPAGIEELFETCQAVSLHTPLLPETTGMIDAALLGRLPEGATFINTARGAVVRECDLIDILTRRPDLTAVLDVTDPEPPEPDSPLYTLPNVHLTPHIAGAMAGERLRLGVCMLEELRRYVAGEPARCEVTQDDMKTMA